MRLRIHLLAVVCLGAASGCAPSSPKCNGAGPFGSGGGGTVSTGGGGGGGVIGGTRRYTITDLGTLGGSNSAATALNDAVQVVGSADTSTGAHHAFLWQAAKMTDLGTLGGTNSAANAINGNGGDVVGTSDLVGGLHHAFLYHNNVLTDLGTLGGNNSSATGILSAIFSSGEQIVGVSETSASTTHGFRVLVGDNPASHDPLTDLGTLGGNNSAANAATFTGAVGSSEIATGAMHAVSFEAAFSSPGGVSSLTPRDLGTLGGANSSALSISGTQIVGTADLAATGASHAFLSASGTYAGPNGSLFDLGTLGGKNSAANAINSAGIIVGVSDTVSGPQHAFVYTNGILTDLNSELAPGSGWVLETAAGINTGGNIVGTGTVHGVHHAYLLTPQ